MSARRFTPLAALVLLSACEHRAPAGPSPSPQPSPLPTSAPSPTPSPIEIPVVVGDPHGTPLMPPAPPPVVEPRSRRRMDLDQLDRAIRQVTGGIGWTERRNNTDVNLFEELAATLGKPDFALRTDEDLTPSAMFQKFLDDAARTSCAALMREDPLRSEKSFFIAAEPADSYRTSPSAVEANVRELLLRFHGHRLAAGDPGLDPWLWLFRRAEHTGVAPEATWRALCVALITHPDFYLY